MDGCKFSGGNSDASGADCFLFPTPYSLLPSVGAGIGRDEVVEEVFLEGGDGGRGERFATRRSCNDGKQLKLRKRGTWNIDTLRVGSCIGRGEMEARVVHHVVEKGNIGRSKPFKDVSAPKSHPQPKSFGARTGKERAPGKALRVHRIVEVEVANVADVLDVIENKRDDPSGEVEEIDRPVAYEGRERQIPGKCFASGAADDDLFVGGGHGVSRIVAWKRWEQRKRCRNGSQFATTVLH